MKTKTEKRLETAGSFATFESSIIAASFGGFDAYARAARNFSWVRACFGTIVLAATLLLAWRWHAGEEVKALAWAVVFLTIVLASITMLLRQISFGNFSRILDEVSRARRTVRRAAKLGLSDAPFNLDESIQDGTNPLYPLGDTLEHIGESAAEEILDIELNRPKEHSRRETLKRLIADVIATGQLVESGVYAQLSPRPFGTWASPWKWPGAKSPNQFNGPPGHRNG